MSETKEVGHPLDQQNSIERAIQLEGSKDPDNFKMPDGRTLTEIRQANVETQDDEYQKEIRMVAQRTREQSIPEFQKGKKLVMTTVGNLIDVTEPVQSEDTVSMAESRTTMADIEKGAIQPLREKTTDRPLSSTMTTSAENSSATHLPPVPPIPSSPSGSIPPAPLTPGK